MKNKNLNNKRLEMSNEDKPLYTPQHIANFFLSQPNHDISNLKLNKLVYIAYGWGMAILNRELFHEGVQAWMFGPVIPSIYHEYKFLGSKRISGLSEISGDFLNIDNPSKGKVIEPKVDDDDKDVLELLDSVYKKYGKYSSSQLVSLTHAEGTPWRETFNGTFNKEIDKERIKKYYESLS